MKKYILAIDQGTASSRALLFDRDMHIAGMEQSETTQYYPQPGWVEQDAENIWERQAQVIRDLLRNMAVSPGEIAAIGITNQRETTIVWDRHSGKPVYNAIIWQDRRTAGFCETLKSEGYEEVIRKKTGLVCDPYFSASKIAWILKNIDGARQGAEAGDLLFGTVDTWLLWNLTGGKIHATDASNASRTSLYNIETGEWDAELLGLFGVPAAMLPEVHDSSGIFGMCDADLFGRTEIPVCGIAGDQQAALFGQACFDAGMIKNTYGTGCFMLMNTGRERIISQSGLLTTVAWRLDGAMTYALEGSVFIAGAAVKWLRDQLGIITNAAETESLAIAAGGNAGVYFVPAFAGLGAPYWDMNARGMICGLTQGVDRRHIARAALEAMAYQTKDVIVAMANDSGIRPLSINVDGGASVNNFLMQFQADILGVNVLRPAIVETTALGAALLAGLAAGFWTRQEVGSLRKIERTFLPEMDDKKREMLYNGWIEAVNVVRKPDRTL